MVRPMVWSGLTRLGSGLRDQHVTHTHVQVDRIMRSVRDIIGQYKPALRSAHPPP